MVGKQECPEVMVRMGGLTVSAAIGKVQSDGSYPRRHERTFVNDEIAVREFRSV